MSHYILIVDDEPNIRMTLRICLEAEGYVVDEAVDGYEALTKIAAYPPDLVMLDLSMPLIDGLEFLRRLKREDGRPEVIVLTAHAQSHGPAALQYGVRVLQKPIDPATLRTAVARALVTAGHLS